MQTVHVNIGISDQHREDIAAGLSKVLANSYWQVPIEFHTSETEVTAVFLELRP